MKNNNIKRFDINLKTDETNQTFEENRFFEYFFFLIKKKIQSLCISNANPYKRVSLGHLFPSEMRISSLFIYLGLRCS